MMEKMSREILGRPLGVQPDSITLVVGRGPFDNPMQQAPGQGKCGSTLSRLRKERFSGAMKFLGDLAGYASCGQRTGGDRCRRR